MRPRQFGSRAAGKSLDPEQVAHRIVAVRGSYEVDLNPRHVVLDHRADRRSLHARHGDRPPVLVANGALSQRSNSASSSSMSAAQAEGG